MRMLRGDAAGETGWRALRVAEKTSTRLRWQDELTIDKVLDSAEALSAKHAGTFDCGSADYLHVAAARRLQLIHGLDEFWTCDAMPGKLARAEGLAVRLFK
jgi:hypothetical protein